MPRSARAAGGQPDGRQGRDAGVLDEDVLGGGSATLHAVHHHHVGSGGDRQLHVVVDPGGPELDEHGDPPFGGLSQLLDLDPQVVGAHPVGVAAGRSLVDAGGKCAHPRHPCVRPSGRAASRRRRASPPGRPRSRWRRPGAGPPGRTRSARGAPGRRAAMTLCAPRGSSPRPRLSSTCPPRWLPGRGRPWQMPRGRRSSCRRW